MNAGTFTSLLWDCAWQSTVFLGIGIISSLLCRRRPGRSHRILLLAIVASLATPLLSHSVRQLGWGLVTEVPAQFAGPAAHVLLPSVSAVPSRSESVPPRPTTTVESNLLRLPAETNSTSSRFERPIAWKTFFIAVWLCLSLAAIIRLFACASKEFFVLGHAKPVDDPRLLERVKRTARRLDLRAEPVVAVSDRVASPVVCGWVKPPVILLPLDALQRAQEDSWNGILCHELAHYKRRDHWAALLGEILLCCLPWHPLAWWVRGRLEHLSELACDRWAVDCGGSTASYAESLLNLVPQKRAALILPVVGLRRRLEERIQHLFSDSNQPADLGRGWARVSTLAGVSLVATVAFLQTRSEASPGGREIPKGKSQSDDALEFRMLVKGWASDFSSCPSADGRYVCDLDRHREWELSVRDLVTGKSHLLTKSSQKLGGETWAATISPDNKYVAYNWFTESRQGADELRLVKLDGSGMRVLYTAANTNDVTPLQWSSDGKEILSTVSTKQGLQLALVSAADGSAQILRTLADHASYAALSPDSRYVAYDLPQKGSTNACDVFILDIPEQREISIITHPADDRFLGWSLDGKWILFSSDRGGATDLWLVPVKNGRRVDAPRFIKSNLPGVRPKGFTRDGSFYYSREFHSCDVYTASLDLETGRLLEAPVPLPVLGDKAMPAWSHDGKFLAYLRLRLQPDWRAATTLAIFCPGTGQAREFESGQLGYYSWKQGGLRWSADDRFILAQGYMGEQGHAYQVNVQSGETTLVAELPAEGKPLTLSTAADVNPEVAAMLRESDPLRKKVLEKIPDAKSLVPSSDQRGIAFTQWNEEARARKILFMTAEGGVVRQLVAPQRDLTIYQMLWTADSRQLLYIASDKEYVTSLWKVSAQGGPARRLWVSNPRLAILAIHPDGKRIAFGSSVTRQHEVWEIANLLPKTPSL